MATNPQGAQINVGLTNYAHQISPDYAQLLADADFLAPRVVAGGMVGNYPIFDTKMAFEKYITQRAYNGPRQRIKHAGANGTFSCEPHGLEVALDDSDPLLVGGNRSLIEQSKTRTLLSNWANSRFYRAFTFATTSGNFTAAADADAGKWSSPNIDPIRKIDGVIEQIYTATGMFPNRGGMDFSSWIKLRNHPEAIKRQPGAANIGLTLPQLQSMLSVPVDMKIFGATLNASGSNFGNTGTTKAAVAAGTCLLFYAQPAPTIDDASAIKTFSAGAQGWENVMTYRENQTASDIFYLDGTEVMKSIAPLLIVKVSIT